MRWWVEGNQYGERVIFASCRYPDGGEYVTRAAMPKNTAKALAWLMVEAMTLEVLDVVGTSQLQPVGLLGGAPC
ncbi:hypothetical protein [Pseudomonas phage Persinger]|uniref:Uncharacterized protein n=1 Tax=Pseudomonas phage Persinger TaxID=2749430 RepID=A0A7D7IC07_9CAUD|nr:hypothetical protein KB682_gp27 [Pseudomonas phage Persinger]QMP19203.1 hypothetical protein [Pseudomonas phage Persinger]